MFGISIAIIIPLLSIVVYTTRLAIGKVLWRLDIRFDNKKWASRMKWKRRKRNWRRWWVGWERDGRTASTDDVALVEKGNGRRFWGWPKRGIGVGSNAEAGDTEKGEAVVVELNGTG
jgi:hypothetical protein